MQSLRRHGRCVAVLEPLTCWKQGMHASPKPPRDGTVFTPECAALLHTRVWSDEQLKNVPSTRKSSFILFLPPLSIMAHGFPLNLDHVFSIDGLSPLLCVRLWRICAPFTVPLSTHSVHCPLSVIFTPFPPCLVLLPVFVLVVVSWLRAAISTPHRPLPGTYYSFLLLFRLPVDYVLG